MNGATTAFAVVTTTPRGTTNEVVVLPYTTLFVRPLEEGEGEGTQVHRRTKIEGGGQSFLSPEDDVAEA